MKDCPWLVMVTELKKERSWKLVSRCSTQIPLMTQASHGKLTLRRKWRKPPWGPLEVPPNENTCSAQGHCKHRLHNWETEGTGPGSTCGRTELFCCLRSSQGTLLHLNYTWPVLPVFFLMILFFCYGSFFQPHQPWDCPAEFYDLYPEEVVGLPANPYVPEVIG